MKIRLLREMRTKKSPKNPTGVLPAGEIIDHPDAWMHVQMKANLAKQDPPEPPVAVAVDDECIQCLRAIGLDPNGDPLPADAGTRPSIPAARHRPAGVNHHQLVPDASLDDDDE